MPRLTTLSRAVHFGCHETRAGGFRGVREDYGQDAFAAVPSVDDGGSVVAVDFKRGEAEGGE